MKRMLEIKVLRRTVGLKRDVVAGAGEQRIMNNVVT
jgi:hypothetical protein